MLFLVRVGEIWLKSHKTRMALMKRLAENISRILEVRGVPHRVSVLGPRILVETDNSEPLKKVFGIVSLSPVKPVEPELDKIISGVKEFAEPGKSFKVSVNRAWKGFPTNSLELQRILGKELESLGMRVDLENPEKTIYVEIRERSAFIFDEIIPGPGGLPYGCQGKALLLFSGGIDSPVAGWLAAKRGVALDSLFINICCKDVLNLVKSVFSEFSSWVPGKLYMIDAMDLAEQIKSKIPEGYRQVVYKRIMYRLASAFIDNSNERYHGIVTGESLGQVSTQTLSNLEAIQDATDKLVIRPLIGMDKTEIMSIARKIGTLEYSEKVPEHCRLERHSRVNVPVSIARKLESKIDVCLEDLVSRAKLV